MPPRMCSASCPGGTSHSANAPGRENIIPTILDTSDDEGLRGSPNESKTSRIPFKAIEIANAMRILRIRGFFVIPDFASRVDASGWIA
jgi:hypothetical protein